MKTYWDSFLDDYELELRYLSIRIALEAFYYYCNNEKDKCDEFIKGVFMTKKHTKSELILEQQCCNIARQKGLVAVKLEKNKHKGIPDYMFIQEGGKCLFVEFKRPDGKGVASGEQLFWAKFLGYSHRFIDNVEEFEGVIEWYFE